MAEYREGGPTHPGGYVPRLQADERVIPLMETSRYPNIWERVIKGIRDVLLMIASLLLIIVLGWLIITGARIEHRISELSPQPAATGCPFGADNCGG